MRRPVVHVVVALALLGAAGALTLAPPAVREVPPALPLELVPAWVQGWAASNHVPADVLPVDGKVREHLLRTYRKGPDTVWVSVGYYPRQSEGQRPPAQELLYPKHGWSELSAQPVALPLDAGAGRSVPATLVLMQARGERLAIAYWYQVGQRSIASDHWYRAAVVYNRIVHRRADGALVRVATRLPANGDAAMAVTVLAAFTRSFHPELLRSLPR